MSQQIAQVQKVLDQVIRAVEFLFGFTLAAGLVVLFAAVSATREARAREFALLRATGRPLQPAAPRCSAPSCSASARWPGLLARAGGAGGELGAGAPGVQLRLEPDALGAAGRRRSRARLLALAAGWWSLRGVLRRPVARRCAAPATDCAQQTPARG